MSNKGFRLLGQGGKGRSRPPGLCQINQGHLWVDLQCQAKYPGHGWGNATVQPDPQHPTPGPVGRHVSHTQAAPIRNPLGICGQICCSMWIKVWGLPRGRNSKYTRRTWRLDAGDVVEGLWGRAGRRVCRVCRVGWWFLDADEQMEASGNGLSHTVAR
jgi:hypothetical protein